MLSLAGWAAACDRARERGTSLPALVDPMCGSGTLLIEGAMMAGRVAPGLIRVDAARGFGKVSGGGDEGGVQRPAFAFERWPDHDPTLLEEVLEEAAEIGAAARKKMGGAPVIIGNDVHAGALSLARRAAMAAGVDGIIDFVQGDAADLTHPKLTEFTAAALERDGLQRDVDEPVDLDDLGPTALRAEGGGVLVVSNPPWGMRIGARDDGYDGDDAGDGYGDGNWDDAASDAGSVRGGDSVRGGESLSLQRRPPRARRGGGLAEPRRVLPARVRGRDGAPALGGRERHEAAPDEGEAEEGAGHRRRGLPTAGVSHPAAAAKGQLGGARGRGARGGGVSE